MIERDKRATKAGFMVGGTGLLTAMLALIALVLMLPLKQTVVELYTVDNHTGRGARHPCVKNPPDGGRRLSEGDDRQLRQAA